jgi:hypothetical protein
MKASLAAILGIASLFCCAAQDKRKPKPAELEVLELQIHRGDGQVALEGRMRNIGELKAEGLRLIFHFVSPDRRVVATKQGALEHDPLEPGQEAEFHLQTPDPVRAVHVRLEAGDRNEREVRITRPGPHPIE